MKSSILFNIFFVCLSFINRINSYLENNFIHLSVLLYIAFEGWLLTPWLWLAVREQLLQFTPVTDGHNAQVGSDVIQICVYA